MRIRVVVRFAALSLCLVFPYMGRAQFQEPTREELSMAADSKAPGAAAVYLNVEEKTDDTLHFHSYYARIKVLTEKGKEAATVRIPYDHGFYKISDVRGRTIHPDGTVIPLKTKASDLIDVKTAGVQVNTVVFTLPDVRLAASWNTICRRGTTTVGSPRQIGPFSSNILFTRLITFSSLPTIPTAESSTRFGVSRIPR